MNFHPSILKKPTKPDHSAPAFEAPKDTRSVDLVEGDHTHQVVIGTSLTDA